MTQDTSQGWQPIETAPRDTTKILLGGGRRQDYGFSHGPVVGWSRYPHTPEDWVFAQCSCEYDCYEYAIAPDRTMEYSGPTHWMPLPPNPNDNA